MIRSLLSLGTQLKQWEDSRQEQAKVAANFSAATGFKLMHLVTCGVMLGSVPQLFSNSFYLVEGEKSFDYPAEIIGHRGVKGNLSAVRSPCDQPDSSLLKQPTERKPKLAFLCRH
ncbi:hypothetical protein MUK42_23648 [Musa troglodytarum]|uniref:Uncharacterized protein n=1 Tax=Musa troglodytarum TaxID=320322 RepID=A0A9E7EQT9_9LILI|nr:hypothetical protein MUK42_23648 [Musa troglodytarum]